MVGRRPRIVQSSSESANDRKPGRRGSRPYNCGRYRDDRDDDPESGIGNRPFLRQQSHRHVNRADVTGETGFENITQLLIAEQRRNELKRKLLSGVESTRAAVWEDYRKSHDELKRIKNKNLRKFYESQNDTIDACLEVDALVFAVADDVIDSMNPDADRDGIVERQVPLDLTRGAIDDFLPWEQRDKRAREDRQAKLAINVNVVANAFMLVAKLVSLRFSPSLSLMASTVDSALDLFCTMIIYGTNRVVAWRLQSLQTRFPVGRRRLEPIGILVFSVIMVVSFLQILHESMVKLLPGGDRTVAELPPVAIGAMVANAVIKGIIGLACRSIKTTQVQALVQDCKTDVYFNTASLLFPLIGVAANLWWLDPLGATLLALFVIYDWAETCLRTVGHLTGSSVDDALQKKLTYLAFRFSPVVGGFKSLTAYHTGDGVWVELDILLDEGTSLPVAHDTAETIQYCYEGLQEVDRAFVTVDYSSLGPTGHCATE